MSDPDQAKVVGLLREIADLIESDERWCSNLTINNLLIGGTDPYMHSYEDSGGRDFTFRIYDGPLPEYMAARAREVRGERDG